MNNFDPPIDEVKSSSTHTRLVTKADGKFFPLFTHEDVCRDKFIQLRKELISLGCHHQDVVPLARDLSMKVLGFQNELDYSVFILNQTFHVVKSIIKRGYNKNPIQNLGDEQYSHVDLFSSIYGFEIEYIKGRSLQDRIIDIGCGDGLFLKLLNDCGLSANGYELVVKPVSHSVKIDKILDLTDVNEFAEVIVLNHVLEHIDERPSEYLDRLIKHMNSLGEGRVKAILISLPHHLSLFAHMASGHRWICCDDDISLKLIESFEYEGMNLFRPLQELSGVARENGYQLTFHKNIGTYVIE